MCKKVKIIGPFLGPRGVSGISINIGLPDHEIEKLVCVLTGLENFKKESVSESKYDRFKLFQFNFENLDSETVYNYKFYYNDNEGSRKELNLGKELNYEDCHFKVLGDEKEKSFILLSCNNPFKEEKGSAEGGWAVWEQLESHLKEDHRVRLIVLGGDQVYNDDIEKEFIKKDLSKDEVKNELRTAFITQYEKYWRHKSYRKIFASVPSVAMWDDHDITDGWGSRPESFPKNPYLQKESYYFKKNWWEYFKVAREAFVAYQTTRNSDKIDNVPKDVFSSYLDWGENRFILCDFRSERNSKRKILWSNEHKKSVLDFIKNSPEKIKKIFFLTPVVPLRTNFLGDKRLSKSSKYLFTFRKFFEKLKLGFWSNVLIGSLLLSPYLIILINSLIKPYVHAFPKSFHIFMNFSHSTLLIAGLIGLQIIGFILFFLLWCVPKVPELPDLSDDIEDGLSSGTNMESLEEILEVLTALSRKGKEVFILSGDIHLGGLTEIIDTRKKPKISILQIVSSPIAYKPMPKVVEGLTTTTSEMMLRECTDKERLFARNIFYISKRNFAQIFPDKERGAILFHFEGHQFPTAFPKRFLD